MSFSLVFHWAYTLTVKKIETGNKLFVDVEPVPHVIDVYRYTHASPAGMDVHVLQKIFVILFIVEADSFDKDVFCCPW